MSGLYACLWFTYFACCCCLALFNKGTKKVGKQKNKRETTHTTYTTRTHNTRTHVRSRRVNAAAQDTKEIEDDRIIQKGGKLPADFSAHRTKMGGNSRCAHTPEEGTRTREGERTSKKGIKCAASSTCAQLICFRNNRGER